MEPVRLEDMMRGDGFDRIPNTRVMGTDDQSQKQMKNVREATKALRDRLKEENKKFDGSDVYAMILFIIVAEDTSNCLGRYLDHKKSCRPRASEETGESVVYI